MPLASILLALLISSASPTVPRAAASSLSQLGEPALTTVAETTEAALASSDAAPPSRALRSSTTVGHDRTLVARLSIPRIGIADAPVYDRGLDRQGFMLMAPGWSVTHYVLSAPFGQGNAVVYGHDDIEGNIFGHLYDLRAGDVIRLEAGGAMQTYRVAGHRIVPPTAVDVLDPTTDARLTLITCWPFGVDTRRWVVTALQIPS